MFRLFGLLLVGLMVALASSKSATAADTKYLGSCFLQDATEARESWNLKKRFGSFKILFSLNNNSFVITGGDGTYAGQFKSSSNENLLVIQAGKYEYKIAKGEFISGTKTLNGKEIGPIKTNLRASNDCSELAMNIQNEFMLQEKEKLMQKNDDYLLLYACSKQGGYDPRVRWKLYVQEAKRRGLSCGVGEAPATQIASSISNQSNDAAGVLDGLSNDEICSNAVEIYSLAPERIGGVMKRRYKYWSRDVQKFKFVQEAKQRNLQCHTYDGSAEHYDHDLYLYFKKSSNSEICERLKTEKQADFIGYLNWIINVRKIDCSRVDKPTTQIASATTAQSNTPSSAELLAAQRKAEELEQQLAALKAKQEQQQQTISSDKQKPVINIAGTAMNGPQGTIKGYVRDNTGVAEVRVDGKLVEVDSYGNFMANTYVPQSGINVSIEAVDLAGLTSSMSVRLDRLASSTATTITFDRLNPLGRDVASNKDALALIIGVNEYAKTPAKAHYADSDAQVFSDYAIQKLGIPANRVKTLVNNNADESGMLLAVKDWLARANRQGKSDIYIFFAGHGLASDDGEKMYLLPYDGSPRLLSDTAIARERLFADISAANPRSVTVFLDTCYSGTTRGTDMLIASRPIAIRALEQSIPDNFTVMTAAAGDQTAKPLEEAKHGMFSYFLMKGMEGEADANNDNEITAGELHSYVQTNVIQQSSGSQTPELQGDADRVLVRFQ